MPQSTSLRSARTPRSVDLVAVRERSCTRKFRHRTLQQAVRERDRVMDRTGPMVAYCCQFCAGWHLGHASRNPVYAALPDLLDEIAAPPLVPDLRESKEHGPVPAHDVRGPSRRSWAICVRLGPGRAMLSADVGPLPRLEEDVPCASK